MAEELILILNELKKIRTYLVKIGSGRRKGEILKSKREEANKILIEYKKCIDVYKLKSDELSRDQISLVHKIRSEFDRLFSEVLSLCSEQSSEESCSKAMAGDTFDLRTALSLLSVMTDNNDNTQQLIENIEYYSSVLSGEDCKKKLIQFVLKSRLSQQAKLKMASEYRTVDELVKDMRRILLPRKSQTALQTRLQHCRQNNKSVPDFGREISELFTDLTISQADGNSGNYSVLRPLNEKLAIKRFADGLRDRRLSTIIAARNFDSLTEAIQAAQDEEIQSTSPEVIGTYRQYNRFYSGRRPQRRARTSAGYTARAPYAQGSRGGAPTRQRSQVRSNNIYRGNNSYSRSNFFRNRRNNNVGHNNMNVMLSSETSATDNISNPNSDSLNHFFRE